MPDHRTLSAVCRFAIAARRNVSARVAGEPRAAVRKRARLGTPAASASRELRIDRMRRGRSLGMARALRRRRAASGSCWNCVSIANAAAGSRARWTGRTPAARCGHMRSQLQRAERTSWSISSCPASNATARERVGAAFGDTYEQLYDEDVAMMVERQRQLDMRVESDRADATTCLGTGRRTGAAAARRTRRDVRTS